MSNVERLPFEPQLSDKDRKRLDDFKKDIERADLLIGEYSCLFCCSTSANNPTEYAEYQRMAPVYEKRKALTRTIPKFWPVALLRHPSIKLEFEKREDMDAIQYLESVDVKRNPRELRSYTIQFVGCPGYHGLTCLFIAASQTFGRNPYFEDSVLTKEFRFMESKKRKDEQEDRDGFKWSMLDFDWEKDVKPQVSPLLRSHHSYDLQ